MTLYLNPVVNKCLFKIKEEENKNKLVEEFNLATINNHRCKDCDGYKAECVDYVGEE